MRVAYVTTYDATDPDAFNGIGPWIGDCMRLQGIDVDYLGPLRSDYHRLVVSSKYWLYRHVLHQRYDWYRDPLRVRGFAQELESKLDQRPVDVVLSGVSPGSQPVAYLDCGQPIVIWTDCTFASARRQNREERKRLAWETRRGALKNEASALRRSALALFTSEWAARDAQEVYGLDDSSVDVVPFGPALRIEHGREEVEQFIASRPAEPCRLLLVGTKWRGKGADIAVDAAIELNRAGLRTELDIVGSQPPPGTNLPSFVHIHGVLRKAVPEEAESLRSLYARSHFFILPTRAEAFGVVFCEASAYGLPSAATAVGGVPTAVRDGRNGMTFPEEAGGGEFAHWILDVANDRDRYRSLALSTFEEYDSRLNWLSIGGRLKGLLEGAVAGGSGTEAAPPPASG